MVIQENINGGAANKIQESSKSYFTRVGLDFAKEVTKINQSRKDVGKKAMSMNVLTNLLIKHNSWYIIFQDLINRDLEEKNER